MSLKNLATVAKPAGAPAPAPASTKPASLATLLADPKVKAQIALALPKHITADRLARIALTELRRVPKLQQCEPMSFLGAVMQCAQLGLEPGMALGHAYILPFDVRKKISGQWQTVRTDAQVIIGYRGMIDLARRSGQIVSLDARTVHRGDKFHVRFGLDPTIDHEPAWDTPDRTDPSTIMFVYAVAKLRDGGTQFEVMSRAEVDAIRARSKAATDGPWVTDYGPMACKTVIRRLFKYLPVSIEVQRAVTLDEAADSGLSQHNEFTLDPAGYDPGVIDSDTGEISGGDDALAQDPAPAPAPAAPPAVTHDTSGQDFVDQMNAAEAKAKTEKVPA